MNFKSIILSAGKGTRMKSTLPKVMHKVCGVEMINHVINTCKQSGIKEIITVLGHGYDEVKKILPEECIIVKQDEQLGTGHAVKMAKDHINNNDVVVVLCGDTPLITEETLKSLFLFHIENNCDATVLTTSVNNPNGYGRILRDKQLNVLKIVEQKDATQEELLINEINSGIYCFNGESLKEALELLNNNNSQNEYYLTDTISILRNKGKKICAYNGSNIEELMGVNSRVELSQAEYIMRKRINEYHMTNGVTIIDNNATYIDYGVEIGVDTILYPGVILKGATKIGSNCIINMNTYIENSTIGDFSQIKNSTIHNSNIGDNTTVGPYAYIRPNSEIGNNVKIGDFVEVKNAKIDDNSKASHLSYIGDASVGKNVNIGCGVVFVNYDGKNKFKSIVKDGAFIGSNSNLVAPVTVEEYGYIATGSTITKDVPRKSLAIAREYQTIKENWVEKNNKL